MNRAAYVAIEGPNGVGKSTAIAGVIALLRQAGIACHNVRQPSDTVLGRFIRESEEHMVGHSLALIVAADRRHQSDVVIEPLCADGILVVSDRHVPSSLVLQRFDGLELADIWAYNQAQLRPDLTVYLEDEAAVLMERLGARHELSRMERDGSSEQELQFYREAKQFLDGKGWPQAVVTCNGKPPEQVASEIFDLVVRLQPAE